MFARVLIVSREGWVCRVVLHGSFSPRNLEPNDVYRMASFTWVASSTLLVLCTWLQTKFGGWWSISTATLSNAKEHLPTPDLSCDKAEKYWTFLFEHIRPTQHHFWSSSVDVLNDDDFGHTCEKFDDDWSRPQIFRSYNTHTQTNDLFSISLMEVRWSQKI